MRTMQAIETYVHGRFFRSRHEARWFCFFRALGLPAEYEIVGYHFPGISYLPDFLLPGVFNGTHIEVKPEHIDDAEERRLQQVKAAWCGFDMPFWIIRGQPAFAHYTVEANTIPPAVYRFAICRKCDGICLLADNSYLNIYGHTCGDHERWPDGEHERIMQAHEYATTMKFDNLTQRPG